MKINVNIHEQYCTILMLNRNCIYW